MKNVKKIGVGFLIVFAMLITSHIESEAAVNHSNFLSQQYGHVDDMRLISYVSGNNTVSFSGWHGINYDTKKLYSFTFIMNADTGAEICRSRNDVRTFRSDVAQVYGSNLIGRSGFSKSSSFKGPLRGTRVYIMSRYTTDPNGNHGRLWADRHYTETVRTTFTRP